MNINKTKQMCHRGYCRMHQCKCRFISGTVRAWWLSTKTVVPFTSNYSWTIAACPYFKAIFAYINKCCSSLGLHKFLRILKNLNGLRVILTVIIKFSINDILKYKTRRIPNIDTLFISRHPTVLITRLFPADQVWRLLDSASEQFIHPL